MAIQDDQFVGALTGVMRAAVEGTQAAPNSLTREWWEPDAVGGGWTPRTRRDDTWTLTRVFAEPPSPQLKQAIARLGAVVIADPGLSEFCKVWSPETGQSGPPTNETVLQWVTPWRLQTLSYAYLQRIPEGPFDERTAREIAGPLADILKRQCHNDMVRCRVLTGLGVREPFEVESGLTLLPIGRDREFLLNEMKDSLFSGNTGWASAQGLHSKIEAYEKGVDLGRSHATLERLHQTLRLVTGFDVRTVLQYERPAWLSGFNHRTGVGFSWGVLGPHIAAVQPPSFVPGQHGAQVRQVFGAFTKMEDLPRIHWLDLAVRRFSDAVGRGREDDKLLDAWIGLEALYRPRDRRKRADSANWISAFLGVAAEDVSGAYKVRSAVAHGNAPLPGNLGAVVADSTGWLQASLLKVVPDTTAFAAWRVRALAETQTAPP
jgi:hypothetical protein